MGTKEDESSFNSFALVYKDEDVSRNCNGDECRKMYDTFPLFNMVATEFETQAQASAATICSFLGTIASYVSVARTINICEDLGFEKDSDLCGSIPLQPGNSPMAGACLGLSSDGLGSDSRLIDAIIVAAKDPKGFLNRKGPSNEMYHIYNTVESAGVFAVPNGKALGSSFGDNSGRSTGGMILPVLQRSTFEELLEKTTDKFNCNHLAHGAALNATLDDGYPHRNAFWNTDVNARSIDFQNILLKDKAYDKNPINLQLYANYNPSVRIPTYEQHVFVNKREELARIRTLYDPMGGFDSPRYPARNRYGVRTVSIEPTPAPIETTPAPIESTPAPTEEKSKRSKSKSSKSK